MHSRATSEAPAERNRAGDDAAQTYRSPFHLLQSRRSPWREMCADGGRGLDTRRQKRGVAALQNEVAGDRRPGPPRLPYNTRGRPNARSRALCGYAERTTKHNPSKGRNGRSRSPSDSPMRSTMCRPTRQPRSGEGHKEQQHLGLGAGRCEMPMRREARNRHQHVGRDGAYGGGKRGGQRSSAGRPPPWPELRPAWACTE